MDKSETKEVRGGKEGGEAKREKKQIKGEGWRGATGEGENRSRKEVGTGEGKRGSTERLVRSCIQLFLVDYLVPCYCWVSFMPSR